MPFLSPLLALLLLLFSVYWEQNLTYFSYTVSGQGALYRYDAVGSYERVRAVCAGRGEKLIQPLLDEITDMEKVSSMFYVLCFVFCFIIFNVSMLLWLFIVIVTTKSLIYAFSCFIFDENGLIYVVLTAYFEI